MPGDRRDRDVATVVTVHSAITFVTGPVKCARPSGTPAEMTPLTGESPPFWRNVTAAITGEGHVMVERKGRGSGRWFLHDILLAESLASSRPERL